MAKQFPIVEITWVDAFSHADEWVSLDDFPKDYLVKTIGYLVRDTKEYVSLAQQIQTVYDDGRMERVMNIPLGCIKERKVLKAK